MKNNEFRSMRRIKQEISREECEAVLRNAPRGVLSVHGENGYPYGVPMDHVYLDGKLYFHCAKEGHKLDAIAKDSRVSYCVMSEGFIKEGEWALNITSVIAFGQIRKLSDSVRMEDILRKIGLKYYPTPESVEEVMRRAFSRVEILELTIDHMTGKIVNES